MALRRRIYILRRNRYPCPAVYRCVKNAIFRPTNCMFWSQKLSTKTPCRSSHRSSNTSERKYYPVRGQAVPGRNADRSVLICFPLILFVLQMLSRNHQITHRHANMDNSLPARSYDTLCPLSVSFRRRCNLP